LLYIPKPPFKTCSYNKDILICFFIREDSGTQKRKNPARGWVLI